MIINLTFLPIEIQKKIQSYLYFSNNVNMINEINYTIKNYKDNYWKFYNNYFNYNMNIFVYRFFKYTYFDLYIKNYNKYKKYENLIYKPYNYNVINNKPYISNNICSIEKQAYNIIYNLTLLESINMEKFIINPTQDSYTLF